MKAIAKTVPGKGVELIEVPPTLSFTAAAMLEPLGVGVHSD